MVSSDQLEYAIANSEIIKNIQSRLIDMDQLLRLQQSASIATSPLPPSPPVTEAIEPAIEDAIKVKPRRGYSNSELSEKINISKSTIEKWKARIQRGEKFEPKVYPNFFDHWILDADNLWYEKN
jgi:ribosome-binding protein aMBF1 (putative translation factor)